MAVMLIGLGIGCYYGAPVAFLFEKFRLFFLILQFLLLFMIIGMTLIAMLLQPYFESALIFIATHVCCRRDRKLYPLLAKNMKAHRTRNLKTATMFACSLAFLIFAGTTFQLIADLIVFQAESFFATDIFAMVLDYESLPIFLHEGKITEFLEEQRNLDGAVVDYSFVAPGLFYLHNRLMPYWSNWGNFYDLSQTKSPEDLDVYGVQRSHMNATFSKFYYPNAYDQEYLSALSAQG
jgi:hypothetical protein